MLDEIKEVESYLDNPSSDNPRVGANLLFDYSKGYCKLVGIYDILALIACHYVYGYCDKKWDIEKVRKNAILIMRVWCGFDDDVTEKEMDSVKKKNQNWFSQYPHSIGWLREYYIKNKQCAKYSWAAYSTKWNDNLKSKYLYQEDKICYDNILAQALARGPLKKYNFIINKSYDMVLKNEIKNENGKAPDTRKQKSIIKLIAAYKMLQKLHPGQKYVLRQSNRILYWMGYKSDNAGNWCDKFLWKGKYIFEYKPIGKYRKFSVNQDFLNELGVSLQEDSIKDVPEGYDIYVDNGHGKEQGLKKL